eukprot:Sdes_comp23130_c0_seq1m21434
MIPEILTLPTNNFESKSAQKSENSQLLIETLAILKRKNDLKGSDFLDLGRIHYLESKCWHPLREYLGEIPIFLATSQNFLLNSCPETISVISTGAAATGNSASLSCELGNFDFQFQKEEKFELKILKEFHRPHQENPSNGVSMEAARILISYYYECFGREGFESLETFPFLIFTSDPFNPYISIMTPNWKGKKAFCQKEMTSTNFSGPQAISKAQLFTFVISRQETIQVDFEKNHKSNHPFEMKDFQHLFEKFQSNKLKQPQNEPPSGNLSSQAMATYQINGSNPFGSVYSCIHHSERGKDSLME